MFARSSYQNLCFSQRQCVRIRVVNPGDPVVQSEAGPKCVSTSAHSDYRQWFPLIEAAGHLEAPQDVDKRHDSFVGANCVGNLDAILGIPNCRLWHVFDCRESLAVQHFLHLEFRIFNLDKCNFYYKMFNNFNNINLYTLYSYIIFR